MKVMKFGGGCLKDGEHFLKVAEIISLAKEKTVVVISAISGITNLLVESIHLAMQSEKNVPDFIKNIRNKHKQIIDKAIKDDGLRQMLRRDIEARIKRLERLLYGIASTEEVTESLRAHILSYGERLSTIILSGVLKNKNKDAIAMDADRIGMITDESYENATAVLPEVKKNLTHTLMPVVNRGVIPVITGYFGCTHEGKITTLGRNGSDYSAAVIAYGIDASVLEIWKDVDGFMSANPKIVKDARRINTLSYYEAAELSYFGAKILYPRTVEPLIEKGIRLRIKNLYKPESQGTEILNGSEEKEDIVKSITYNKQISVLKIRGPGVGFKPGIIADIGRTLSDKGINIYSVITSQTCINLLIDQNDSHRSYEALEKLVGGVIERVDLEENIALIAVVGEGLLKKKGVAARVFSAVAEENINVEMISSGASEVAYYFIVKENDVEKTIKAVHREFFEKVK